ncbi:hypothetical protein [Desulfotomaculum copahuensis]|uniref:Uncharacterized protein n=1 Tax=Desulfotomaculum copahuensis TaxID=1838280 RepID=A0A1B7LDC7_9FIRM|nr:hypothetical protein [Desulfotomaculum copahuensis]OAT81113.1 hypothetical protein A6M21_11940 [Desulfotomaculum copahuensis]
MISQYGMTQIANKVSTLLAQGAYIKDGQQVTVPIFRKEYSGNAVKVYLYLTDEDIGTFSDFQILDEEGNVILTKPDSITKDAAQGLLVAFEVSIQEVES